MEVAELVYKKGDKLQTDFTINYIFYKLLGRSCAIG
jgi:hypothetical protein